MKDSYLDKALGGYKNVPKDWMPATQVRPLIFDDPGVVWLKHYGSEHGLYPEEPTPYDFLNFIFKKGRQFQDKWVEKLATNSVRVCKEAYEVNSADKVKQTFDLMKKQTPLILEPALWWAPEKIHGVPDLIIHTSWLLEKSNTLIDEIEKQKILNWLKEADADGCYIVFDVKFTTKLEERSKAVDLESYATQVRIYTYMLGHIQGIMPESCYLITRDGIFNPLMIPATSTLNEPLDADLAELRDNFIDIKLNGDNYLPWRDNIVAINIHIDDDLWKNAKKTIAWEKIPGRDSGLLYQIGPYAKQTLAGLGYPSLDSMLNEEPENIPFESCSGLGPKKSKRIRAVLEANRKNSPVLHHGFVIPDQVEYEFFVDFEYFTNLNVDFDIQWPTLEGCEMIFMIGAGWIEDGQWNFKTFTAKKENQQEELKIFEEFLDFLKKKSNNIDFDTGRVILYHWSNAEVWQTRKVIERHNLPKTHLLNKLPWNDLQKSFLDGPLCVPGIWDYGLKNVAKALGDYNPEYDLYWPGELGEGLRAMVMGWKAYEDKNPLDTKEISIITEYLEADCRALLNVLRWLRDNLNKN